MDLYKVKTGDKVYSCLKGWGRVREVKKEGFRCEFKGMKYYYTFTGRAQTWDLNPEITDWKKQKKKEWTPPIGKWGIFEDGIMLRSTGDSSCWEKMTLEGNRYNTREQAKHAYKSIRACQILNAYVAEYAPEWRADWDDATQEKYYINLIFNQYDYNHTYEIQALGVVYMPESVAVKLSEDLRNGVVKL